MGKIYGLYLYFLHYHIPEIIICVFIILLINFFVKFLKKHKCKNCKSKDCNKDYSDEKNLE